MSANRGDRARGSPLTEALRQLPYFSELPAGPLAELARQVRQRRYRPGETILLEGEPSEGLFFVIAGRSVIARVAKLLLDCARGDPTPVEAPGEGCARLTQQQVAAMTGSVREVVQRALKTLERDEAVKLGRARITILDMDALERWSQSARAV